MHAAYLCPLKRGSKFGLNKLEVQRNCNATDADLFTSDDANSISNYALESLNNIMLIRSSARGSGTSGPGTSQVKSTVEASTNCKHVEFSRDTHLTNLPAGRSWSKGSQHCKSINSSAGASGIRTRSNSSSYRCPTVKPTMELTCHSHAVCSMLVPLTCNQSNFNKLQRVLEKSSHNAQETPESSKPDKSKEQVLCDPPLRASKTAKNLLAGCGVPYWNIYEYEHFREVQNTQIFDPMTDGYLHRESIIHDCYNRLQASYPRFRKPQLYHVR